MGKDLFTFRELKKNDLELMVEYEKSTRVTEEDVFLDFDERKYRIAFLGQNIDYQANNRVILCFFEGRIIGRVDLIIEHSFMDFHTEGYIDWIYVVKPHRGKGIAKQLISEAEKFFREEEIFNYYLFVAKNKEAMAFYKSIDVDIKLVNKATKHLI